jgi:hypothetical protein
MLTDYARRKGIRYNPPGENHQAQLRQGLAQPDHQPLRFLSVQPRSTAMLNDLPFEASPTKYFPRSFSVDHLLWQNWRSSRTAEELAGDLANYVLTCKERRESSPITIAGKAAPGDSGTDQSNLEQLKALEAQARRDVALAAAAARRLGIPVEGHDEEEWALADDRSVVEALVHIGHLIGLSGAWIAPPEADIFWAAAAAITTRHGLEHPNDIPVGVRLDQIPDDQPSTTPH